MDGTKEIIIKEKEAPEKRQALTKLVRESQ
jgi:hypothetical protein